MGTQQLILNICISFSLYILIKNFVKLISRKKKNMFNHQDSSWTTSVPDAQADPETVATLRQRLRSMKEIFGEEIDSTDTAKRKRASKRRNGNCIDNIIDGSFMEWYWPFVWPWSW